MQLYKEQDYKGEFNLLQAEKELIIRVNKMVGGNIKKTAYIIGVTEKTIHNKIKRHNLKKENKLRYF